MFNSRERALVLGWSGNLLARVGADSPEALELTDWLNAHADELGLAGGKGGPLEGRHPAFPARRKARSGRHPPQQEVRTPIGVQGKAGCLPSEGPSAPRPDGLPRPIEASAEA